MISEAIKLTEVRGEGGSGRGSINVSSVGSFVTFVLRAPFLVSGVKLNAG